MFFQAYLNGIYKKKIKYDINGKCLMLEKSSDTLRGSISREILIFKSTQLRDLFFVIRASDRLV